MNNVKELCIRRGIEQKELSILVGVSQPTVSDWFNQKKNPSGKRLDKLSEVLGVSRSVILGYDSDPQAPNSLRQVKVDRLFSENDAGFTADCFFGREENPLMEFYLETMPKTQILDGQPLRGLRDDKPETQNIAAEVLAEALNHGVTKEEALAFIRNYAQLMPQERKTIMSNMMFLRSQHNEEEGT